MRTSDPSSGSSPGQITLRYWASARAAAGTDTDEVPVRGPVSLAELTEAARDRHRDAARFAKVLSTCSVLVGDRPVASDAPESVLVEPGQTVEFLPPFAGG